MDVLANIEEFAEFSICNFQSYVFSAIKKRMHFVHTFLIIP